MDACTVRERDWANVITAHEGDPVAYVWRLEHFTLGEHELSPPPPESSTAAAFVGTAGVCLWWIETWWWCHIVWPCCLHQASQECGQMLSNKLDQELDISDHSP
jgi:hypothetical protein